MKMINYVRLLLQGALLSYTCSGAEQIGVSFPGGIKTVHAERLTDGEEQYLQFSFPTDSDQRVLLSSHYGILGDSIIGFKSRSQFLMINPPLLVKDAQLFPVPENSYAIKWETIFDWDKASGPDSRPAPPLSISAVSVINDSAVEISVHLRSGDTGEVTLRKSLLGEQGILLLERATVGGRSIPIFDQPRLLSSGEVGSQPPLNLSHVPADEKPAQVWSRIYSDANDRGTTVAKAIVDGREQTWVGPRPGGFTVFNGTLYGVAVQDRFNLLIRPAIPSEELQFALPTAPVDLQRLKKLEERFTGNLVKLEELLKTQSERIRETIDIRNVGQEDGSLSISISAAGPFPAELKFTPSTEKGFLVTRRGRTDLSNRDIEQSSPAPQPSK